MGMEFVYVLHFHQKLAHAEHYVGSTGALDRRLRAHANGAGARLMEVLKTNGMTWELGGLYSSNHAEIRRLEKKLKSMHNARRYCQICHPTDQAKILGTQKENIELYRGPRESTKLITTSIPINHVQEVEADKEEEAMKYILSLMRKDKDALGFVPIGGKQGIKNLLEKRQIIMTYENAEPCGYAFYTMSLDGKLVNIHQACTEDGARLKGHGTDAVEFIANKHPESTIVAKVRDDLAANHFWQELGFTVAQTVTHPTSGSTIHHYHRKAK